MEYDIFNLGWFSVWFIRFLLFWIWIILWGINEGCAGCCLDSCENCFYERGIFDIVFLEDCDFILYFFEFVCRMWLFGWFIDLGSFLMTISVADGLENIGYSILVVVESFISEV